MLEQMYDRRLPFVRKVIEVDMRDGTLLVDAYVFQHFDPERLHAGHPQAYVFHDEVTPEMAARRMSPRDMDELHDPVGYYIDAVMNG